MKPRLILSCLAVLIGAAASAFAADNGDSSKIAFYEMRTYHAAPGKLDDLNARFRDHTMQLFEKHGMRNVGYWVPVENSDNKLIYMLGYPSREARDASWKAFMADPDWQKAQKASEANGRLVTKVDSIYLRPTDFSPALPRAATSGTPRLFELRTYTASPGKLDDLEKRFRDRTMQLFEKHGMTNIGYWVPTDKDKGADNTLIYIIAHPDKAAADASWAAFRKDPDWDKVKKASEVNGALTIPNGVKSVYMKPTDYSPLK